MVRFIKKNAKIDFTLPSKELEDEEEEVDKVETKKEEKSDIKDEL